MMYIQESLVGQEHNAKSFRSGNSVAIRMPAALGVEPGMDWTVVEQGDDLVLRPKQPPRRTIDVSGFAGKAPWLKPLPPELREFDERPSTIAAGLAVQNADDNAA
jgi:antitoxin VapB